jgi:hypothetical protein
VGELQAQQPPPRKRRNNNLQFESTAICQRNYIGFTVIPEKAGIFFT